MERDHSWPRVSTLQLCIPAMVVYYSCELYNYTLLLNLPACHMIPEPKIKTFVCCKDIVRTNQHQHTLHDCEVTNKLHVYSL